jgi:dipeptidyl aminopeptidase/acylaminoacyl peptidase
MGKHGRMEANRTRILVALLLTSTALPTAKGQAPVAADSRGLDVATALSLRSIGAARVGEGFVAFTRITPRPLADGPGGSYHHLGVVELPPTGFEAAAALPEVKWLVAGAASAPGMAVRPGRREVSFLRVHDGALRLFVQPIDGGDAAPFAATPAVTAYRWRPDGRAIAFTTLDEAPSARAEAQQRGFRPVVVDEDWRHLSLWVVDEGNPPRRLTEGATVFDFEWSPDGQFLACAVAPQNLVDDSYMFQRLHVVDAASGERRLLVDNPGKLGGFVWSPDGARLAYVTAADRNDPHAGAVGIVDIASGRAELRAGSFSAQSVHWWRPAGSQGSGALLAVVALGVKTAWLAIDGGDALPGGVPKAPPRAAIGSADLHAGWLAFTASAPAHPAELFVQPLAAAGDDAAARRLTDSNPELAAARLGEQEVVKVRTRDGLTIEGLCIKPVGHEAGRRYPLVIVAHGGPEAHFSDGWLTSYSNWGQLLAARGYVSWYPNYRSSTGYGTAFCKHDHGDPMGKEFEDHLDAIDHFVAAGLVDRTRVGIGGGSYGGYTAAWAATRHSEHFAAAVSFVPFVDIRTKWLTSDIPQEFYYVHYQERWPWQQPGLLADRSPLTWAEHCRTPLLLLGGTHDTRVHPSQPFMLYRAVKFATATPVRYVQYPGEGHGNRTNVYQFDYALRTLQWFDHYLAGEPPTRTRALPPFDLDYPK